MQRYASFASFVLILLLQPLVLIAQPEPTTLHAGDVFPQFSGKTLTGKSLELPTASAGRPAVVVFSFSRVAAQDARLWNERLSGDTLPAYTVILLESAPKLFRRLAVSGIKSRTPPPMRDRTIVSYHDESLWKQRLAVSDDSRAYLVLLGPEGHVRWSNSGPFTDAQYAHLRSELETLLQRDR